METRNRTIVKNSLYMYARMLVLMIISLYTSRVVLQTLGIDNYGIYNIVGGLIVMFTFVSNAMATGTQRHISFELGKKDGNVPKVFSACFFVHLALAVLLVVLGETIGLWFFKCKLVIPPERISAAEVVYQVALFSTFFSILKVPFNATIIAYEKFSFYAYSSIIEGVLKLLVALSLLYVSLDKLVIFSVLNTVVVLLLLLLEAWYVFCRIRNISIARVNDREYYRYIFNFTGWTIFGSCANIAQSQGLNIIINMFYGVALNAAVGISSQVSSLFDKLIGGLQSSLNPQLVKAEAGEDKVRQMDLICRSSKFSFAILLVCALPIITHLDYILELWLGTVPDYTSQITVFVIVALMLESLSSSLYTTVYAIGNIKKYQLVVSVIKLLTVLIAYFIAIVGLNPSSIYMAPCIIALVALCYRLFFLSSKINDITNTFLKQVVFPLVLGLAVGILPFLIIKHLSYEISVPLLVVHLILEVVYLCVVLFFVSLTSGERRGVLSMGKDLLNRLQNK